MAMLGRQQEISTADPPPPDIIDWKAVLDSDDLPLPALKDYLEENKEKIHSDFPESMSDTYTDEHAKGLDNIQEVYSKFIRIALEITESILEWDTLMEQQICVDIGVDVGDSCDDYTANTVPPTCSADHFLKESE